MLGIIGIPSFCSCMAASDRASHNLEKSLGPFPIVLTLPWVPVWDQDDALDLAYSVPDQPNIWSDYMLRWRESGHSHTFRRNIFRFPINGDMRKTLMVGDATWYVEVTGMSQKGSTGPNIGVMLCLQAVSGIHIGIDNLSVLVGVAGIIDGGN